MRFPDRHQYANPSPPGSPPIARPVARRTLLSGAAVGTAALATATAPAPPATAATTFDGFMRLSEVLTDKVANLRDAPGQRYFAFLVSAPAFAQPLARLIAVATRPNNPPQTFDQLLATGILNNQENAATAQQVLILWYSGLVDGQTADYLEALAWTAQEFAEPPSTPLGFPDWEDRP